MSNTKVVPNLTIFDRRRPFSVFTAVLSDAVDDYSDAEKIDDAMFVEIPGVLVGDATNDIEARAYVYEPKLSYRNGSIFVGTGMLLRLVLVEVRQGNEVTYHQVRGYDTLHRLDLMTDGREGNAPSLAFWIDAAPSDHDDRKYDLTTTWYVRR